MTREEMHAWARIAVIEFQGAGAEETPLYAAVMDRYEEWGNTFNPADDYDEIDDRCLGGLAWFRHDQ